MQNSTITSLTSSSIGSQEQRHFWVEYILIFLAFAALFVHSIPVNYIAVLVLLYTIVRSNLFENVFGLIVFYPNVIGYIFNPLGIDHMGGVAKYLGFALLLAMVLLRKAKLNNLMRGLFPLIMLILMLTLSVYTTIGGDYATSKLNSTIRHSIMVFFAYSLLFSHPEKYDFTKLGMLYMVLAFFLIPLSIPVNGIAGPSNLFDFGFLRYQTHEDLFFTEEGQIHISYQGTGFLLLIGFGFYIINSKKYRLYQIILMLAIVILAQLYIGSRQAVVSILVMTAVWALFINRNNVSANKHRLFSRFFVIVLLLGASYYIVGMLTSEEGLFSSVAEEGYIEGSGRGEHLLMGINQFLSNPVWGVGYGRFLLFGYYGSYPHNLFVELLCETGLVGFTIAMVLGVSAAIRYKKVLMPFLLLWLAYFLRSMASGSLSLNITVFVILFALSSARNNEYLKTI